MIKNYPWWQKSVIYQIYPRSFQDSKKDGIGDLQGIIKRLDYLKSLGVKAIWLSPIYPSPMYDFGYDISDYKNISSDYGDLNDFDELVTEVHKRNLKLIMDLVPNHTSSEHNWFKESRSSRDNPKRDWYIWKDPAPNGGPPNNWVSYFGGSAWEYDEKTGQYYLHLFAKQQPDLNYRNPEVKKAMLDVMRFWLDRGVDGFRIDVICSMIKDSKFRDEPMNPDWDGKNQIKKHLPYYTNDLPEVHQIIKDMRKVVDEYDNRVMIGETYLPYKSLIEYYGENNDELHQPFNFHLLEAKWDAAVYRKLVDDYEAILPENCWPNYALGNHDQKRIVTRLGSRKKAAVANMLLLTLRGTPTVYYGDEIGMHNVRIPPELVKDPPAVNQPKLADEIGRDPERTPMQWDDSPNAGFTDEKVTPWLPVAEDYKENNVKKQLKSNTSMLSLFKRLMGLRQSEIALQIGDYESIDLDAEDIFAYQRKSENNDSFLVVLNFEDKKHEIDLSYVVNEAEIAAATDMQRSGKIELNELKLEPEEGLLLRIKKDRS